MGARLTGTTEFLPFALPDIGEEEIAEVVAALRSGWLTTGPRTVLFERNFAQFIGHGVRALAVSSATAGLHLSLEALGIGPGDEVITTPFTFTATAEVLHYLGAHPVFADIDPVTLNLDPQAVERALTPRTRALLPVHFAGLACPMEPLLEIARRNGLRVVEDAAHAIPATYQGSLIGALESDATVYSFYATKPIATGEGGMVVTRDERVAERCRLMRLHGIDRDAFDRYRSERPSWYYEVVAAGFKYNMTDVAAALGLHQLRKAYRNQRKREWMAHRYDEGLSGLPLVLPAHAPLGDLHAWHLYVVRLGEGARVSRDQFVEEMALRGIGTSVHFIPLYLHPYWRQRYGLRASDYPNTQAAYERCVSLPIYTRMTASDQDRVIDAIRDILG